MNTQRLSPFQPDRHVGWTLQGCLCWSERKAGVHKMSAWLASENAPVFSWLWKLKTYVEVSPGFISPSTTLCLSDGHLLAVSARPLFCVNPCVSLVSLLVRATANVLLQPHPKDLNWIQSPSKMLLKFFLFFSLSLPHIHYVIKDDLGTLVLLSSPPTWGILTWVIMIRRENI